MTWQGDRLPRRNRGRSSARLDTRRPAGPDICPPRRGADTSSRASPLLAHPGPVVPDRQLANLVARELEHVDRGEHDLPPVVRHAGELDLREHEIARDDETRRLVHVRRPRLEDPAVELHDLVAPAAGTRSDR